jgi:hypothetical protein
MPQFDDSDPEFFICYTGEEEVTLDDARAFFDHWAARLNEGQKFGVILVYQQPTHEEHDDADEEHKREEQELMRAFMDFGRNNKEKTAQFNPAYAQVVPQRWVDDDPEGWEKAKVGSRRFAQYHWGIPSESFT